MKKIFTFLLIAGLFSCTIHSQSGLVPKDRSGGFARVYSMGGDGGVNYFIVDPINMRYNPAFAKYYTNFLWGDIGASTVSVNDGDGQLSDLNFSLTKDFTLGAILARNDYKGLGISGLGMTNNLVTILNGIGSTTRNAENLDKILSCWCLFLERCDCSRFGPVPLPHHKMTEHRLQVLLINPPLHKSDLILV